MIHRPLVYSNYVKATKNLGYIRQNFAAELLYLEILLSIPIVLRTFFHYTVDWSHSSVSESFKTRTSTAIDFLEGCIVTSTKL